MPELCKAYTPGKTDQDLSVRLARLEQIIELALPQYFHSPASPAGTPCDRHNRTSSEGPDEDNRSITDGQDPSGGTFQSGKWYGNSASGSIAPASVLEQVNVSMIFYIMNLTHLLLAGKRRSRQFSSRAVGPHSPQCFYSAKWHSQCGPQNSAYDPFSYRIRATGF